MTPELKRYSIRQSVVNDCEVCTWEEDRLGAFVSFDDAQEVMRQARAEALEEAIRKCKAIKPVINSTHGHGVSDAIDVLSALKQQPQERE